MAQIGMLWPHEMRPAVVHGVKVKRASSPGSKLGDAPVAVVIEGGGREVAVLTLSEDAARQLHGDLGNLVGARPIPEAKPAEPEAHRPERPGPGPKRS